MPADTPLTPGRQTQTASAPLAGVGLPGRWWLWNRETVWIWTHRLDAARNIRHAGDVATAFAIISLTPSYETGKRRW